MSEPSFLQSADWARFQKAVKHDVAEADGIRFFKTALPLGGSYLYCPHPDVADPATFLDRAVTLAKEHGAWFVRVEPNVGSALLVSSEQETVNSGESKPIHHSPFTIHSTLAIQPADTWHVPLGSDEVMLAAMHEKTRYNVKLAEKKGVTVRFSSNPTDVKILTTLLEKTGDRAGIRLHAENYYRTMIEILGVRSEKQEVRGDASTSHPSPLTSHLTVELAIAESEGRPVAAAVIAHYGDRVIYLHGGSDYDQRALMAPHLLHWAVMRRSRDRGVTVYDMGGVAPEVVNSEQETVSSRKSKPVHRSPFTVHPWSGITRFKQGFGGQAVHYPPAVDAVVNRGMYLVYTAGRALGRLVQ